MLSGSAFVWALNAPGTGLAQAASAKASAPDAPVPSAPAPVGAASRASTAPPAPSSPPSPTAALPPAAPVIVPPHLMEEPDFPYPAGARGDAAVLLIVTVNADGSVRSARAQSGDEPFASAATSAIGGARFSPATRDGRPLAATIRFEVDYHAPAPAPSPAQSTDNAPPNPDHPAAAAAPPLEVTVEGERLAPAVSSFTRAEVRQLPGAFGDPFRAIEALPGVTPIASGLPFFYVRGAPPGNVGYFLDGVRVPYLYHVGLGPSVVHPGMVDRVDLYPGGYPASFGRYTGGIVSGETTAPSTELHGEANLRVFDVGALAETGFAGGRGSVLIGGRYSYTAAIVSLLAPNTALGYRDYQLRVSYALTPNDRVTAFGFGSYDLVAQTTDGIQTIVFGSEFYRLDLRYDHSFSAQSELRTAVTLGFDQTRIADERNSQDRSLSVRSELHHSLQPHLLLRAGADLLLDGFSADQRTYADPDDPNTQQFDRLFPARTDLGVGAHADVVWTPEPWLEITPGLRADLFTSAGASAVSADPRISARFSLSDRFRIVHAYGIAHQPPSFVVPIPGLVPGKLSGGLQTSLQTSAGIEWDLFEGTTATATLFHSAFFNMNDALGAREVGSGPARDAIEQRSRGESEGLELFIRRRLTQHLGGYLSYTLSRSTRAIDGYVFPSAFDRTHVASTALAYDLGAGWRAGARFVFYTGVPKTPDATGPIVPPPAEHPARDPGFHRIDVRLEKRWSLGERAWISFVAEVLNTTLEKETFGDTKIGPVTIPSIGLEAGF